MNQREAEYVAAWLALANRLVEWERACREDAEPEEKLVFDSNDQATLKP